MIRYKCEVEYDGSRYYGLQRQPNFSTVQGEIERALSKVYSRKIDIVTASRTDRGVHATNQVFHFDAPDVIPSNKLLQIINRVLNDDINIYSIERVEDCFHARYSVKLKTYRYDIKLSKQKSVFLNNYYFIYPLELSADSISEIAKMFIGKRDFQAVMARGSDKDNTVRTVFDIYAEDCGDVISVYFTADGFLYNMVRIVMGAILDVIEGKRSIKQLEDGLRVGDRSVFNRTVPACGLYLVDVKYDGGFSGK